MQKSKTNIVTDISTFSDRYLMPVTAKEARAHCCNNVDMVVDEIFEGELLTDCSPTLFWVVRRGDKIGIITRCNATDIIYDSFTGNDEYMKVTLFQNGIAVKKITSF